MTKFILFASMVVNVALAVMTAQYAREARFWADEATKANEDHLKTLKREQEYADDLRATLQLGHPVVVHRNAWADPCPK